MARPRKELASSVQKKVDKYFNSCIAAEKFPSEPGLILHLGIEAAAYQKMCVDAWYSAVFEKAKLQRMDWLENRMVTEPKLAQGCKNALTQEKNGGYVDKAVPEAKARKLTISLSGVGKAAAK